MAHMSSIVSPDAVRIFVEARRLYGPMADPLGIANQFNPLDQPSMFDGRTVARHRARAITRADRRACGDGKWVLTDAPWDRLCRLGLVLAGLSFARQNVAEIAEAYCRAAKTRYRWQVRR